MPKPVKKQSAANSAVAKPSKLAASSSKLKKVNTGSKQARVIALLQSPAGTTIAAMMKATGWQQHSVRGFLAAVIRKRLKLKLTSKKSDGTRTYQIASGDGGKPTSHPSKRQRA
jgi:hypothetical protein